MIAMFQRQIRLKVDKKTSYILHHQLKPLNCSKLSFRRNFGHSFAFTNFSLLPCQKLILKDQRKRGEILRQTSVSQPFFCSRHPYLVFDIYGGTPGQRNWYEDQGKVTIGGIPDTSSRHPSWESLLQTPPKPVMQKTSIFALIILSVWCRRFTCIFCQLSTTNICFFEAKTQQSLP